MASDDETDRHLHAVYDELVTAIYVTKQLRWSAPSELRAEMNDLVELLIEQTGAVDEAEARIGGRAATMAAPSSHERRNLLGEVDNDIGAALELYVERLGQIASAVATLQDITSQERLERSEREFVTNAAHELQSPLAAIRSAVDVLQAGAKDTADRDLFLEHIEREALRLGRIVRALLTLARVQTGVEEPRVELIDVRPLLERIADTMEPAENVELIVDCPNELAVLTNQELLEQSVSNLVRNAVKHTTEGSIRLSGAPLNAHVEVRVADTGSGIPNEVLPRVFDRFYRANPQEEGFGLGLAIVNAAVDAMGGELEVESKVGEGTTISMRLPGRATLTQP